MPIWLDLVASPADWSASFLSAEAKEVLAVLGGVVVVFTLPSASSSSSSSLPPSTQEGKERRGELERESARELIRHVGRVVREGLGGWEWDGVGLAVGVGGVGTGVGAEGDGGDGGELDEWEDLCAEFGLEFVHVLKAGGRKKTDGEGKKNEFGERMGVARMLEALEANDWSGGDLAGGLGEDEDDDDEAGEGDDDGEFDPESLGFGFDREDFVGLRKAIWGGGGSGDEGSRGQEEEDEEVGEDDVQKLEKMMLKLQAVRDASAGLPEEQRKRMAARAVGEVMKEL